MNEGQKRKVELLAPAGNLEKLKMAIIYGADAVYFGGEAYSLRAAADNFSLEEMKEGVEFAHKHGKKAYITLNIFAHNRDLKGIEEYLKEIKEIGPDAIIVSDLGVFDIVRETLPDMEIHISTQANNTNWRTVNYWHKLGAKRVVLARELSLSEIKEIHENTPKNVELEAFVHGAMCISYSGRCLLSNYLTGRESNMGACAHPCRWEYHIVEEKRPGEFMPIMENERGTFIFNSKDLCMLEHIPELIDAGIMSFKIEGRMKSSYYVSTIVRAYRMVIDAYLNDPEHFEFKKEWYDEITKASHRNYTTGFFFHKPAAEDHVYDEANYVREYEFVGLVKSYDKSTKTAYIEQRNRIFVGDEVEIIMPSGKEIKTIIKSIKDEEGNKIETANHPQMKIYIPFEEELEEYSILRKKN